MSSRAVIPHAPDHDVGGKWTRPARSSAKPVDDRELLGSLCEPVEE